MRIAIAIALFSSLAVAQPPPAPTGTLVAVTPLRDGLLPPTDADRVERQIVAALDGSAGLRIANARGGKLFAPRKGVAERFAEDPAQRALALGAELKAPLAVAVDAAQLGDDIVLYLQGVDVAHGRPIASTAVTLKRGEPERELLQGALVRVLAPEKNVGQLVVNVDVPNAQILVDGVSSPPSPLLPVGTHTLRVTNPAYRDFLRFVTIEYGHPTRVDVALSKYPVDEGELRERERARAAHGVGELPWWKRWYTVGAAGVVLLAVTTVVAAVLAHDSISANATRTCCSLSP